MQKFKKVNIEYVLDRVMYDNTQNYQSDFDIDKRILINEPSQQKWTQKSYKKRNES